MSTAFDTVPNISRLIEDHLFRKREREGKREIVGGRTWRASKLGSCLRAQWLELVLHQTPSIPLSAKSLKRFAVGEAWSRQFKEWFDEMGLLLHEEYEIDDEVLNIGGHVDFIVGDQVANTWRTIIELKSVNSMFFWHRVREAEVAQDVDIATDGQLIQAATYDVLLRRMGVEMPALVVPVSKDDLTIEQTQVTEKHRVMALSRINILNECLKNGTPPECECQDADGLWGGREWRFCDYYPGSPESIETAKSRKVEGEFYKNGKPKYEKYFEPDSACCVIKN